MRKARYIFMKEKVILAYSGGLDTTAIIPWLKENFDYEVVCVCIDCGQAEELDGLDERAKFCGAEKLYILDVIDEFCDEYVVPCVQANAIYENKYLLGTSMARPLIAKKLVDNFPEQNFNYHELFCKISRLNMYIAKIPSGVAAKYFYKNSSIYFSKYIHRTIYL